MRDIADHAKWPSSEFVESLDSELSAARRAFDDLGNDPNPLPVFAQVSELQAQVAGLKDTLAGLRIELDRIHASDGWKSLTVYYKLRNRLLPDQSRRQAFVTKLVLCARWFQRAVSTTKRRLDPFARQRAYFDWIARNEPGLDELDRQRKARFSRPIRIRVVASIRPSASAALVAAMINSVLAQTYADWELCLVESRSLDAEISQMLIERSKCDPRIRVVLLPETRGTANMNAALESAGGTHVMLLNDNDTLAPFALFEVAQALDEDLRADFVYSDEDRLDAAGRRSAHHFKPDWSPDSLRSHNFIGRLFVLKRQLLERIGGLRDGPADAQDYDLTLRATELAEKILHIPKVLYHRRHSALDGKTHAAARQAVQDHLRRSAIEGIANEANVPGVHQVVRCLPHEPLVSIIIPTCDQQPVLERCVESIARSTYKNTEIILVENNSRESATFTYYRKLTSSQRVRLLTWDKPFNYSALNNFAAAHALGEVVLLLNNDTKVLTPDWIERMLEHALRPEVGAVGAKLIFPDDTIQHGGVVLGIGGVAGHAHLNFPRESPGYQNRLAAIQNVSAVTAACLMMRKRVFEEVGGFDEKFMVAFNDVDLCLRIRQTGRWIVWTPYAELYHYEQKTRGRDTTAAKKALLTHEMRDFMSKWWDVLQQADPFYSPNLSLEIADFTLKG